MKNNYLLKKQTMSRKKTILLGSGLILATAGMASTNLVIESTDLGNSFDHKNQTFEANEVESADHIFTPSELNCAYGYKPYKPKRNKKARSNKAECSASDCTSKKDIRNEKRKEKKEKRRAH